MRKILFFGLIFLSLISFSQAPQKLNYQGVARDAGGTIINTGNIGIRFEILQGATPVYQEEMSVTPSAAGIFTAAIGTGTNQPLGLFSAINWATGTFYITVSIDPTGGTAFSTVGTSQLLSVPYALYAETSGNAGTTYSAGPGISISSGSIINTAQDQTVSINQSGIANVTGTYPNYTVDVPNPVLNYNSGTQVLSLTQGTAVTTATITSSSTSVSITGSGVSGAYPNYTITPPPATSITAGNSNITVTGAEPNFTISSVPTLSIAGAVLSISNGNAVTLPTGTTYTNGAGIALTSGTIITNTAPNQTVTIGNGTNVNVTGTYPNFVVNSTPTLSIASNTLSISGGNSITLPPPLTPTAGPGISIISGTISNTAPNQTVSVTGPNVVGTYPNYTVTAAPSTSVSSGSSNVIVTGSVPSYSVIVLNPVISGAGTTTVNSAGNNYTVNTPPVNLSYAPVTGILSYTPAVATNTINISPSVSFASNILTVGSSTVSIPGTGVWTRPTATATALSNISDFVGIGTNTPAEKIDVIGGNVQVDIDGKIGTRLSSTGTNGYFIPYDNLGRTLIWNTYGASQGMLFGTNNLERMRINNSGNVGIGTSAPGALLDLGPSTAGLTFRATNTNAASGVAGYFNNTGVANANTALQVQVANPAAPVATFMGGHVGIGQTAPTAKLHLSGTNTATLINTFSGSPETALRIHNDDLTNNNFSSLIFSTRNTSAGNHESAKILGVNTNHTSGSIGGDLVFMTREPANILERMRITSNGNIGIRTQNPTAELEINGYTKLGSNGPAIQTVKLTGSTAAGVGGAIFLPIPVFVVPAKIISVTTLVQWSSTAGDWIAPSYTFNPGYEFFWWISGTNVVVANHSTNSGNILNKPIVVHITYEQ